MSFPILYQAKEEIIKLREANRILSAQMGIVEVFAAALGLRKNEGGLMAPDVLWEIQQELEKLRPAGQTSAQA